MTDYLQSKLADEIKDNKYLKNTIKLDGEDFNVKAVHSEVAGYADIANRSITAETADKTQKSLTFEASLASGVDSTEFNGLDEKTIAYVPASGGKFTGPVYISKAKTPLDTDLILTEAQVSNKINQLTGSPVYTWSANGDARLHELLNSEKQLYKLNTITGTTQDFDTFKKLLNEGSLGLKFGVSGVINNDYTNAWCSVAGVNDTYDKNVVIPYTYTYTTSGTKIKLPVTKIEASAFKDKAIESLVMADSITSLGTDESTKGSIFAGCTSLKKVTLSNKLERIESATFQDCEALSEITVPDGITTIASAAFSGCTSLKTVTLPKTIKSIGDYAFANCPITYINYSGTADEWATLKTTIGKGNEKITDLSPNSYKYENAADFMSFLKDPFMYICRDISAEGEAGDKQLNAANDIYLKLPNDGYITKISRGATRLDSTDNTAQTQKYYTYETLVAIIASINKRLEGLGNTALVLPNELKLSGKDETHIIIPDNIEVEDGFEPESIPTVQQLQEQLTKLTGKSFKDEIVETTPTPALKAVSDKEGQDITTGYYQSTNTTAVNRIFTSDTAPTEETVGNIGDICIVFKS